MAEEGAKIDFPAHERTYAGFVGVFKWGTIAVAILVAIVILIIS